MKPNILLMGFKSNWKTAPFVDVEEYVDIIQYV